MTELQPIRNNYQILQEACYSSLDTVDQIASIEPDVFSIDDGVANDDEEVLLSDLEESGELTEQQRCLKLNRKYQVCDLYQVSATIYYSRFSNFKPL